MISANNKLNVNGYAYIFYRVPPGWRENGITAFHTLELHYLFGLSDVKDWRNIPPGPEFPEPRLTDADDRVGEAMMRIWTQFARTGNPSIDGFMEWPAWKQSTDNYLYINDPLQVKTGFSKVVS